MADAIVVTTWVCILVLVALAIVGTHKFEPTRGRQPLPHLIFLGCALFLSFLIPAKSQAILFSTLSTTLFGVIVPIYESIRAVCTPRPDDDTSMLQYWCTMAAVFFVASYLDDYKLVDPGVQLAFRQFELYYFVWLWLPFTDGSTLLYDYVIQPIATPILAPIAAKMGDWIHVVVTTTINAVHLWILWLFFVFLPVPLKRFVMTAVGVAYPLLASTVALTTTEDKDDDTFWLTYWSCYGTLFVLVDWLERWLGIIPGFYAGVLFGTVYLMLPMFNGAEKLFRNVLVPIAGMRDMLLLRDAVRVKKDMIRSLPPDRREEVRKAIAGFFSEGEAEDYRESQKQVSNWWKMRVGGLRIRNNGYGSVDGQENNVV